MRKPRAEPLLKTVQVMSTAMVPPSTSQRSAGTEGDHRGYIALDSARNSRAPTPGHSSRRRLSPWSGTPRGGDSSGPRRVSHDIVKLRKPRGLKFILDDAAPYPVPILLFERLDDFEELCQARDRRPGQVRRDVGVRAQRLKKTVETLAPLHGVLARDEHLAENRSSANSHGISRTKLFTSVSSVYSRYSLPSRSFLSSGTLIESAR